MSEGQIQDDIRLALGGISGLVLWRNMCGQSEIRGRFVRFGVGNPGGADLIGLYNGRFVGVEVKAPKGRLSDEQKRWGDLVTRNGGVYVVLRSAEEAVAWARTL